MAENFEVIIGADGKGVTKTLKELKKDFQDFQKQLNVAKGGTAIAELNKKLDDTRKTMAAVKSFGLGDQLSRIKPGASQAAAGLTDVSRIIQDLPYGIMGVGNNLNPMIDSFARLKTETGSSKAAIAAMAGSLIGPAGLGIAVAAITTAFTIYQNGIMGFNKKTSEAKDKAREFLSTLRGINDISTESKASVYGQIASLDALTKGILDSNKSNKERKRLLDELDQQTNGRLGKLSLEASNLATLTTRVNEYTNALIAQAAVKGFEDEISKVSVELAKQSNQFYKLKNDSEKAQAAVDNFKGPKTATLDQNNQVLNVGYLQLVTNATKAKEAMEDQANVVEILHQNMADLSSGIKTAVDELSKFQSTSVAKSGGNTRKSPLEIQIENLEKLKERIGLTFSQEELLIDLKAKFFIDQNKWLSDIQKEIVKQSARMENDNLVQFKLPVEIKPLTVTNKPDVASSVLGGAPMTPDTGSIVNKVVNDAEAKNAQLNLMLIQERLQNIGKFAEDFLSPAFDNFFNNVISGSQSFGQALGNMFKQLLQQIVVTLAKAAALAAIFSALGIRLPGGGSGFGGHFNNFLGLGGSSSGINAGMFGGLQTIGVEVFGRLQNDHIAIAGQRGAASLSRRGGF